MKPELTVDCVVRESALCCLAGNIDNRSSITTVNHVLGNRLRQEEYRPQVYIHYSE